MLGYIYASGLAVEVDPINAYLWFSLAARAGDTMAMENLSRLTATLSEAQKAAGEARLKTWKAAL